MPPTIGSPALVVTRPETRPTFVAISAKVTFDTSCPARTATRRASARFDVPG